jgi:hypothetical protein
VQKRAEQSCGMCWYVTSDQRTVPWQDQYRLALAVGFRGSAARQFGCWGQHQAAPLLFRPPSSDDSVLGQPRSYAEHQRAVTVVSNTLLLSPPSQITEPCSCSRCGHATRC